ncbi:VCBS repeat-containing protein [Streptomyces bomunensis]|uniref:VCBS repeat-containing protein n=1 Tax=Streptomyces montanisoli TaxID=2798581 RepID=A0A940ML47_9ACTN|nr:VCBS repeat-containing protein [Streptomyces montanisoli]
MFANPSGTFTQDVYATPQWTQQDHTLVPIDPTLTKGSDGRIATKATTVAVSFSDGGSTPMATVVRDGRSMSFSWPTALPTPQVADNTVTYPNVLPDVDLKLQANNGGFSQLLVVKSATAAANPDLRRISLGLATDGLTASTDSSGNLSAVNPAGQQVFVAPAPRMWDSSTPTSTAHSLAARAASEASSPPADEFEPGQGAQQADVPITVTDSELTLAPDQPLLTGDDTTYPVYIDPAVTGGREAWTIAYKSHPDGTFYNGAGWGGSGSSTGTARVGYENQTNGLARTFFRMDSNNLWNTKKQVVKSTFRIKNTWSWSCTARPVELWLTGSISSSTSWNHQPSWSSRLDTVNDANGYSSSCPAANLAFDVTSAAKKAAASRWNNITLGMRASNESDVYGWKKFSAKSAVLSTTYNTLPNTPTNLATVPSSGGCDTAAPYTTIGNTDVTLTAKVSDPDGGTVKGQFRLWGNNDYSGGAEIFNQAISVPSGSVAKVKVPKATLSKYLSAAKGTFGWKVQTLDSSSASSWAPSTTCRFNFDPNRPSSMPTIASTDFPDGSDGWPASTGQARDPGTFTITNGGVSDVTKYEYWTDWDTTVRTLSPTTSSDPKDQAALKLTPPAAGAHRLAVRSLDAANNRSDTNSYYFYANGPSTPDKPGDLNGDGIGDLYGIRTDGSLRLYAGQGNGFLAPYTSASNTDFDGASITHRGDWTGDGYEDLVALLPGSDGKSLAVFPNNGRGYACTARDEQADGHSQSCLTDEQPLDVYDPADNHWANADQILAIGDVDGPLDTNDDGTIDVPGHTDLIVKTGDLLWLYYGSDSLYLDETRPPVLIGNGYWSGYDIAAPGDHTGDNRVDLFARNRSSGDLRQYAGTGPNGEGLAIGSTATTIGTHWTDTHRPLLTATPDTNQDGKPDIWATGEDGKLYFYSNSLGSGTEVGISGWDQFQQLN